MLCVYSGIFIKKQIALTQSNQIGAAEVDSTAKMTQIILSLWLASLCFGVICQLSGRFQRILIMPWNVVNMMSVASIFKNIG